MTQETKKINQVAINMMSQLVAVLDKSSGHVSRSEHQKYGTISANTKAVPVIKHILDTLRQEETQMTQEDDEKAKRVKQWMPPNFANDAYEKPIIVDEKDMHHPDKIDIKPGGLNYVNDTSHATMAAEIADLRAMLVREEEKRQRISDLLTETKIALKNKAEENARLRQQVPKDDDIDYHAECRRLMGLISTVLAEATENPQRLVAFNSPLLGMLLIEYHAYTHGNMSAEDQRAYDQYKTVYKNMSSGSAVDKVA